MVRIKETKVYKFDELSEQAQDRAIERLSDINVDFDWWEFVYSDAADIGLKLTEFDIDRNRYAKGYFTLTGEDVANAIITNHGNTCETYKTASNYLAELERIMAEYRKDNESEDNELDIEDIDREFLHSLLEDYSIMLQHEYEYQTSREAIIETIKANEYEFDENGNLS